MVSMKAPGHFLWIFFPGHSSNIPTGQLFGPTPVDHLPTIKLGLSYLFELMNELILIAKHTQCMHITFWIKLWFRLVLFSYYSVQIMRSQFKMEAGLVKFCVQ